MSLCVDNEEVVLEENSAKGRQRQARAAKVRVTRRRFPAARRELTGRGRENRS